MKIHLDGCDMHAQTGPNVFAQRLTRALLIQGHDVVLDDGRDCDASVVFIEPTGRPLAKKVIQRLDGIWTKPHEFVHRNRSIRALYDVADAVVWQSEFDKTMIVKHWGDKIGHVIRNGIDVFSREEEALNISIRDVHPTLFVCSANWHSQKRLKANIELFFRLRDSQFPNAGLVILGANPDCWISHPSVYYTGSLSPEKCLQIYEASDWMLHLAYADHCPNTVIEALSRGCPVVCSNIGGTKELVGDLGHIIDEGEFAFEPFDHDAPPNIDVSSVVLPPRNSLGGHCDIDIMNVAKKYVDLVKEIV